MYRVNVWNWQSTVYLLDHEGDHGPTDYTTASEGPPATGVSSADNHHIPHAYTFENHGRNAFKASRENVSSSVVPAETQTTGKSVACCAVDILELHSPENLNNGEEKTKNALDDNYAGTADREMCCDPRIVDLIKNPLVIVPSFPRDLAKLQKLPCEKNITSSVREQIHNDQYPPMHRVEPLIAYAVAGSPSHLTSPGEDWGSRAVDSIYSNFKNNFNCGIRLIRLSRIIG